MICLQTFNTYFVCDNKGSEQIRMYEDKHSIFLNRMNAFYFFLFPICAHSKQGRIFYKQLSANFKPTILYLKVASTTLNPKQLIFLHRTSYKSAHVAGKQH